jgi:hypothetical protein
MRALQILLILSIWTLGPVRSGEVRLEPRPGTDTLTASVPCAEGTHRVLWQVADRLTGPWQVLDSTPATNGQAILAWKATGTNGFLRAQPRPTPGFLERLTRLRARVLESWAEAALLEAHLLVSDWTEGYPDSMPVRGIFAINQGTVTAVENAPGDDIALSIADRPWLGSQTLAWPIRMDLEAAESTLRAAGYGPSYRTLTLRQPIYPGMVEPYWIFGTRAGFVFVGSRSGAVKPPE